MTAQDLRPLGFDEERLWRALNRMLIALPKALEEDLLRDTGLSLNSYAVLVSLSEAEGRELRMSDLAAETTLSASRITRLVEEMRARGLVVKRPSAGDRRGVVTALTDEGMSQLRAAYPYHLRSARRRFMDQVRPANTGQLADTLHEIAKALTEAESARP